MRTLKCILLPILGIVAAILAFRIAAPFENTLNRPWMGEEDPRALFTWGTKWGEANRIAFGALVCGPFAVVLALGRRSALHVILAGVVGSILGAILNFITDSGADLIGIWMNTKRGGAGPLVAMCAWCIMVPIGIATTLVVAQGVTAQRVARAKFAVKYAIVASLAVQFIGGMLASQDAGDVINLQSQIPVWRMVEIAVGLAFALTILAADEYVRVGTIRLMHGKNEFVDWSLDHQVNQIGSAEGCEIYVKGFKDVAPVHALIVRQGDRFMLDPKSPTQVNGTNVGQTVLNSQDVITVGNAQLVFTSNYGYSISANRYSQQIQLQPVPQQPIHQPAPQQPIHQPQPIQQSVGYPHQIHQPVQVQQPQPPLYMAGYPNPKVLQDAFGQQIPLPPGRYGVGRDMTNAICLYLDPQASASHAEVVVTDTSIVITDLGSSTGTRVNGAPISAPVPLRLGDVLEIGASRFTYVR